MPIVAALNDPRCFSKTSVIYYLQELFQKQVDFFNSKLCHLAAVDLVIFANCQLKLFVKATVFLCLPIYNFIRANTTVFLKSTSAPYTCFSVLFCFHYCNYYFYFSNSVNQIS